MPDSKAIIVKGNVRSQGRMHSEIFHLDQIQNGRLLAIIYFSMCNIWKTVPDKLL